MIGCFLAKNVLVLVVKSLPLFHFLLADGAQSQVEGLFFLLNTLALAAKIVVVLEQCPNFICVLCINNFQSL